MLQKHPEKIPFNASDKVSDEGLSNPDLQFDLDGKLLIKIPSGEWQEVALFHPEMDEATKQSLARVNVVWVPTEQVTLMRCFVPGRRRSDWLNALPYALEELLSEPVEQLHFAPLHRDAQGMVSVAVVSKNRMHQWVEQLERLELNQAQLVADCFKLSPAEPVQAFEKQTKEDGGEGAEHSVSWSVYRQNSGRILVRTSEFSGFAATPEWFEQMKALEAIHHSDLSVIDSHHLADDCVGQTAGARQPCRSFNLRQGQFQSRVHGNQDWMQWRWPLGGLALFLIVYLAGVTMQAQQYRDQAQVYRAQTEALFKARFPEVKRIINIRTQAKSALARTSGQAEKHSGPSELVHKIEGAFAQYQSVRIVRLDWKAAGDQLSLKITAPQVGLLQDLTQTVQQKASANLKVKNVSQSQAEGVLYVDAN